MSNKHLDDTYVAHTYARFPVEIVSGKGSLAYDIDGKEYVDMGSGIGVTCFGIADDVWQQAVTAQLAQVQHMSNLYYTAPCAKLAATLCEKTGMKRVFFSNSGAEANECAIKAARKYAAEKKGADCYTIITLENSFHGRTLTTLAATGQDHFHKLFTPLTNGFVHVKAGDLAAVEHLAKTQKIAGILIECVQGEGGVIAMEPEFVKGLAAFCKDCDLLLADACFTQEQWAENKPHLSAHLASQLALEAKAKKLVLTHFPDMSQALECAEEGQKVYPEAMMAYPGLHVEF